MVRFVQNCWHKHGTRIPSCLNNFIRIVLLLKGRQFYWIEGAYGHVGALIIKTLDMRHLFKRGPYWKEGAKSNHYGMYIT